MPSGGSSSGAAVWAILRKECLSEWRTRYGLNAALLFAVTSLASVSFVLGPAARRPEILSAMLWIVLLFAALAALSHTFVREVEGHTMSFMRMVAPPTAIALGKLAFNLLFLLVLEAITLPLFLVLMGAPAPRWGTFLAIVLLGSVALAGSATLVGAIIAQARARGALFAAISIPILLPLLAAAVSGTRAQWQGASAAAELRLLAAYAAGMLGASLLVYDHLWED